MTERADNLDTPVVVTNIRHPPAFVVANIRCGQESVFPDPGDCRRYFHCQRHELFHVTCDDGLWFDRRRYRCDSQSPSTDCRSPRHDENRRVDAPSDVVHGELVKGRV